MNNDIRKALDKAISESYEHGFEQGALQARLGLPRNDEWLARHDAEVKEQTKWKILKLLNMIRGDDHCPKDWSSRFDVIDHAMQAIYVDEHEVYSADYERYWEMTNGNGLLELWAEDDAEEKALPAKVIHLTGREWAELEIALKSPAVKNERLKELFGITKGEK